MSGPTTFPNILTDTRVISDLFPEDLNRRIIYRGVLTPVKAREGHEGDVELRLRDCARLEIVREIEGKPFRRPMSLICRLTEWFTPSKGRRKNCPDCKNEWATDRPEHYHTEYTEIACDFAPYSFIFTHWGMLGGLLYHGLHDQGGDGGPSTFSVNLSPLDGWGIHT